MTKLGLLPAALMAVSMLATPAMASSSHVTSRHFEQIRRASPTDRYIEGRVGISVPHVSARATPPDGENCDVGDNPFIC
jgi:hypothetical protein